jgi:hypothetical protein
MDQPPPLPHETLARVLRFSGLDGYSLVFIAGGFGAFSAIGADWLGAAVGGLAASAGLAELHGRQRLKSGHLNGVSWMVSSQFFLLAVVLAYVAYQYFEYDPLPLLARLEARWVQSMKVQGLEPVTFAEAAGCSRRDFEVFFKAAVRVGYVAVGIASILCQGGLAFYYHRKRGKLAAELHKS